MSETKTTPAQKPNTKATAPPEEVNFAAPETVSCVILRDYWDANGERHHKGTRVSVSVEEAFEGIESGALKRVKADAS